tara:strand:+ start:170 stop:424 length:255 start_codon:yes stop_codon:yes gene_type:complete
MGKKSKANMHKPGYYPATKEEMRYASWCIQNNIKIGLEYAEPHMFKICINIKSKVHKDPVIREGIESLQKQYEYYKYYYEKYKK